MIKFWKRHSLSISLGVIFTAMVISSWPLGYYLLQEHPVYWKYWLAQTVFSCEADVGGALLLVLFTKWFREYKSASSNDTPEEIMEKAGDVVEDTQDKLRQS